MSEIRVQKIIQNIFLDESKQYTEYVWDTYREEVFYAIEEIESASKNVKAAMKSRGADLNVAFGDYVDQVSNFSAALKTLQREIKDWMEMSDFASNKDKARAKVVLDGVAAAVKAIETVNRNWGPTSRATETAMHDFEETGNMKKIADIFSKVESLWKPYVAQLDKLMDAFNGVQYK